LNILDGEWWRCGEAAISLITLEKRKNHTEHSVMYCLLVNAWKKHIMRKLFPSTE
jgi:capsule polysaccharide export protein KpsC/LpsZ